MSNLMSKIRFFLMSEFWIPVTVNIIDILRRRIRRKSCINAVCHRAARRVPHIRLSVLFGNSKDIQIRREGVTQRISIDVIGYPGFQTHALKVHSELFGIELEELGRFAFQHLAQTFGYFHPPNRAFCFGPVYLQPTGAQLVFAHGGDFGRNRADVQIGFGGKNQ